MTVADAIGLGLVPKNAIVLGDASACICVNTQTGHPVICIKVDPNNLPSPEEGFKPVYLGDQPTICYNMRGDQTDQCGDDTWTDEQVTDELAGGFVGSILDCFDQMSNGEKRDLLALLGLDSPDELADLLREAVCPLLDALFSGKCPDEEADVFNYLDLLAALAERCTSPLLPMLTGFFEACNKEPPGLAPLPEPEPVPPGQGEPPPKDTTRCCPCGAGTGLCWIVGVDCRMLNWLQRAKGEC